MIEMKEVTFVGETDEGKKIRWVLEGRFFFFIMSRKLYWDDLYAYLNSHSDSEEIQ